MVISFWFEGGLYTCQDIVENFLTVGQNLNYKIFKVSRIQSYISEYVILSPTPH